MLRCVAHGLGLSCNANRSELGSKVRESRSARFGVTRRAAGMLSAAALMLVTSVGFAQIGTPPPTGNNDNYSVDEEATLNVAAPGVLANDLPADGNLSAELVDSTDDGNLTFNADGSFQYVPDPDFFGTDTFMYRVFNNGLLGPVAGNIVTVTITVNGINDPPVANDNSYSVDEDTVLTVNAPASGVLGNDTDADGNTLTVVNPGSINASNGTLNVNANGTFTYTPNPTYSGSDGFTYTVTDGTVTDTATVTITVNEINDPPIANDDSYATGEDTPLNVNAPNGIRANDTDEESATNALTVSLVAGVPANQGALNLASNGSFTFNPALNFFGVATFTYRASDGVNQSNTATVTITVNEINDPPIANDDSYVTDEDTPLAVNAANGIFANDTDPDDALSATLVENVENGMLVLNTATGAFTYTPDPEFNGIDTFTYEVDDGEASDQATVTITVTAVNDPPIAMADTYSVDEDTLLVRNAAQGVLANDTDEEGGTLTAQLVTGPSNGTLALDPNGSFTYTPNPDYSGGDSFTYRAVDNGTPPAQSAPATVTITVNPINDPPVANDDAYTIDEDTSLTVPTNQGVLANDADPDPNDTLSVSLVDDVANGTLMLNPATGSFSYTPNLDFNGTDTFTYVVSDNTAPPSGPLESAAATVTITVTPVNDPPRPIAVDPDPAIPDQTATEHVPFTLDLAAFFIDPENDPISFPSVTGLPDGLTATLSVISGMPALETSVRDCTMGTVTVIASDGVADAQAVTFCLRVIEAGRTDLTLSLAASPGPALISETVEWAFTVENLSMEPVASVVVEAMFSGQVPFTLDAAANCTVTPQGNETALSCTGGPVPASDSATIAVTGRSTQAGDVLTTATVSVDGPVPIDFDETNNSATGALNIAESLAGLPAQKLTATEHRAGAAGDFNGDGFIDLAVATGSSLSTLVYPNIIDPDDPNAAKRVLSGQAFTFGGQGPGSSLATADLDGDGALDIVTANRAGRANGILLNASPGDGSFGFTLLPDLLGATDDISNAVAIADVNGDSLLDIVFANSSPNPVFLNRGGAVFTPTADAALGDEQSVDVAVADLFGDALPELVFANADGDPTIYSFDGAAFTVMTLAGTGPTTSVAAGDFDGDGRIDLVFGRASTAAGLPSNPVFLNTSNGTAQFFPAAQLGASPTNDVFVVDPDEDGDLDIVAINATGGHQVYVNNGNGAFTLHAQQFSSAGARTGVAAKLSVDDRVDVAVTGPNGIDIFYNDGRGNIGAGDTDIPVITLLGQATIELTVEDTFNDPGATARDPVDGDVTDRIVVDNPVDTAVIGTYQVTYSATDRSGNAAVPATRTVTVAARSGTGGGGGGAFGLGMALFLATLALARAPGRARLSWSNS